ncbi:hypothetical protein [Mycolicibacter kumamotonensis]|uniref:Uncharacterized protein n=1 Tax=Mycolicibacter kumamotonensis TaxID=354243 RepID=A0A7K3LHS2_9MYCO|nr:hypothetical protein [Mycolicibacter kumamotonensis]NDJ91853.1 hypothetical protein [Mycolicibacter kumamotonensis]
MPTDAQHVRPATRQRADEAEALRAEADAAAEVATLEIVLVREALTVELQQVRAEADEAAAAAAELLATVLTKIEQARAEAATARGELGVLQSQAAAECSGGRGCDDPLRTVLEMLCEITIVPTSHGHGSRWVRFNPEGRIKVRWLRAACL